MGCNAGILALYCKSLYHAYYGGIMAVLLLLFYGVFLPIFWEGGGALKICPGRLVIIIDKQHITLGRINVVALLVFLWLASIARRVVALHCC